MAVPAATVYLDKLTGIDIVLRVYKVPKQEIPDLVKVKQMSIFFENKSGRLAEVTKLLARNRINVSALSLAQR